MTLTIEDARYNSHQADIAAAVAAERERCAKIADEYAAPNRFSCSDEWRQLSPAEVYDIAATDIAGWIAGEIRGPKIALKNG